MDPTEAANIHRTLTRELRDAERRVAALRKLIEGYEELFPDLRAEAHPDMEQPRRDGDSQVPRGQEAAERVLREHGEWLPVPQILAALEARGWAPQSTDALEAVRTTMSRLYKRGRVERQKSGRSLYYRYRQDDESEESEPEHENDPAATGPFSSPLEKGGHDDGGHHRGHPPVASESG